MTKQVRFWASSHAGLVKVFNYCRTINILVVLWTRNVYLGYWHFEYPTLLSNLMPILGNIKLHACIYILIISVQQENMSKQVKGLGNADD